MVSHGQAELVNDLLADLARECGSPVELVLTHNVPESGDFAVDGLPFPVRVVRNEQPKGFGANHNAAFGLARGRYFAVLNPDVRLRGDPFPPLLAELAADRVGVVAPRVVDPSGAIEDNARRFPTFASLLRKALAGSPPEDYVRHHAACSPDWVAGMFMLFRREAFAQVGGFDERFFLYYEDVDICARLRREGYGVRLQPRAVVIHDARRESRRGGRHAKWHLGSMGRYLLRRYTGRYG